MAMPTTAINRFDLSMSYHEFALLANRAKFIGLRALPPVGVGVQSSKFLRINVESLLKKLEGTERAPGATYKRDTFEWTQDSYATDEHGVEETLDDRTIKMYRNEINAERVHALRAVNRVLMSYEDAVASAVFNTTTWTGAALTTSVSALPWSTAATAKPITDIDAAIEKVKSSSGMAPNTLIVTDFALRKMKRTAQIEDLLKYSGHDDPKNLGILSGLRELFGLEQILVAEGFKNTADPGQSTAFARLWDVTMAMVCHVNTTNDDLEDPSPNIGRTIMWADENVAIPGADDAEPGVIIEEYREERRRGSTIRARMDRQIKILHAEAGHLLTGVTA